MAGFWDTLAGTLAREFSDVADAEQAIQLVLRLSMAALLGGAIGLERELDGKAAGIRTHMLLSIGSALFILVPLQMGMSDDGLSRVVQGLLAGIGFLCAGSILKSADDERIQGLTTSAGLWLTSAIGLAAGMGREMTAIVSTVLALVILRLEKPLKRWTRNRGTTHD